MGNTLRGRTQPTHERGRRTLIRAFADTSILLGFLDGHEGCIAARQGTDWITTHVHLLELYSILTGRPEVPPEKPLEILQSLLPLAVAIPHGAVQPAAEIRRKLRAQGKDCSYVDALGYGVAQSEKIALLIADDSFEGVHGVRRIPLVAPARRSKKA